VSGSGMALIASLFDARLRTRIIAISQGTFTACHLSGPIVGGMFAAMHWWRGSFWMMAPLMLVFAGVAHWKIPDRLSQETECTRFAGVPFLRFGTLAAGVLCVAASGSVPGLAPRILLIAAALVLVGLTFWLDRRAADNLFPRSAMSVSAPIGLALWILALHGMTQTSVTLFLPLLLQVVHQVSPIVINFLSIVISMGWTAGTFAVSGWSGKRERIALASGPVIATTGLACLTAVALLPELSLMTLSAFMMGIGIGVYNVHLVARAMDSVRSDEHRSTASALASVRSIGTAFGAAIAGVVANVAGLGDATEPGAVGNAVTAVYMFCCVPFALAAVLMFRFVHIVFGKSEPVSTTPGRAGPVG
jgi:predicted MFS family arabinose efflux permease